MDWQGLLKWSIEHSDGTSERSPMAEGDMKFLQRAIREFLDKAEDPNKAVREACDQILKNGHSPGVTTTSLAVIDEWLDNDPEMARNLVKLNAVWPIVSVLRHKNCGDVAKALRILAISSQNNLEVQSELLRLNVLQAFLVHLHPLIGPRQHLQSSPARRLSVGRENPRPANDPDHVREPHSPDAASSPAGERAEPSLAIVPSPVVAVVCQSEIQSHDVKIAAMGAISSSVRNCRPAMQNFLASEGMEELTNVLRERWPHSHKMQLKAINLLSNMVAENALCWEQLEMHQTLQALAELHQWATTTGYGGVQFAEGMVQACDLVMRKANMSAKFAKLDSPEIKKIAQAAEAFR